MRKRAGRRCLHALAAIALPFAAAAQDTRRVAEPVAPPACAVLAASVVGKARAQPDDTARIQAAIDACPPRQAVRLERGSEEGVFTARPLMLKPGVTLLLDAGVTLRASTDPRAYDWGSRRACGTNDNQGHGCRPFIAVEGGEGGGIMGEGAIDGRGGEPMENKAETWWQLARRAQRERLHQNVPRLIEVNGARDFTLYGITLRNSPNFHVTLNRVDGFTAWGVKIDAPADARNTDGIDPISSRNVSIVRSFIRTGDDNVAIKAGRAGPSENITVAHNHFYNGHGMSIGSETVGGVRDVVVEGLTMEGSTSGLRIKSDISRGGEVRGVRYADVCLRNVRAPLDIDTRYDPRAKGYDIPSYTGIALRGVRSLTPGRIVLRGFDDKHPLAATLDGVVIDGDSTLDAAHARFALGPGPVSPRPSGEDVQVTGDPSAAPAKDCEGRFVPFPEGAAARPQLTEAQARDYSYDQVLAGWDPLADPLATGAPLNADYVVDGSAPSDGRTTFRTVQAAVSTAVARAAATQRRDRVYIRVKPGTYRELVYVPQSAPPITLYGDDADASRVRIGASLDALTPSARYREAFAAQFAAADASIAAMFAQVADRATVSTPGSAAVWIRANGFQARNVTFENAYNKDRGDDDETGAIHSQAVALMADDADRVQFENVRFIGFQDTLYLRASSPAKPARTFFHHAYVEGDMDFIFGEGTAYFLESEIRSLGDRPISYILAPSTHYESRYGFVFRRSAFTHDGTRNALAGKFKLARQWFRGQRCTPFASVAATPGYTCTLGPADTYEAPRGTISRVALDAVGKVAILESRIGAHIDKSRPWADWNVRGTLKHRPAQYDSDDYWDNLAGAGIDPVRDLGHAARKQPAEPFLAEYRNTDNRE